MKRLLCIVIFFLNVTLVSAQTSNINVILTGKIVGDITPAHVPYRFVGYETAGAIFFKITPALQLADIADITALAKYGTYYNLEQKNGETIFLLNYADSVAGVYTSEQVVCLFIYGIRQVVSWQIREDIDKNILLESDPLYILGVIQKIYYYK